MTITLPDDIARLLAAEAERRGTSVEELVAEAITARFPTAASERPARRRLEFVAMGESTSGRTAAEAEDMLAEGFGRD